MNKKLFFLVMTKDMEFYKCFKENLISLNYRVFIFISSRSKINHYINYLKFLLLTTIFSCRNAIALVIRPDLFNEVFLKKLTKKIKNNYGYQWDGLSRYPKVISLKNIFKKFFVFDSFDKDKYDNTYLLNNFYFDCYNELLQTSKIEYDVYFVGSYDDRIHDIISICEILKSLGLRLYVKIPCNKNEAKRLKKYEYIHTDKIDRTYKTNLLNIFKSKIILDFSHKNLHNGLSFRVFESVGYKKKLITNNKHLINNEILNDNILIIDNNTTKEEIKFFVQKELTVLEDDFINKYSFTNWLKNF